MDVILCLNIIIYDAAHCAAEYLPGAAPSSARKLQLDRKDHFDFVSSLDSSSVLNNDAVLQMMPRGS